MTVHIALPLWMVICVGMCHINITKIQPIGYNAWILCRDIALIPYSILNSNGCHGTNAFSSLFFLTGFFYRVMCLRHMFFFLF